VKIGKWVSLAEIARRVMRFLRGGHGVDQSADGKLLNGVNNVPLFSLVQTARRQGVLPRQFLETLFTADTATAQAALYNNSS
jgi:hypothetical protein